MYGETNFHIYWSSDDLCSLLIPELPSLMIRFPNKEFATIPTPMGTQSLREFKILEEPSLPIKETAKSLQSCPTLCDPIDGSLPGSPVPGILQARTLEWVAISFSNV